MPLKDLRDWIALLEREGELVRVSAEVDPDLEITEIVDRTVKAGLLEKVRGDDVDLTRLPVQRCWPGDPAPFITLPVVITHDPQSGGRNVGMYRMQVIDRRTTFMHWQIHKDGRIEVAAALVRLVLKGLRDWIALLERDGLRPALRRDLGRSGRPLVVA